MHRTTQFAFGRPVSVLLIVTALSLTVPFTHAGSLSDGPALGFIDQHVERVSSDTEEPTLGPDLSKLWPPIKVPYCVAPISAFELAPWSSSDSYVSEIDARYFSGGSIPSLITTVDTTTLPEQARLSQICGHLRDTNALSDLSISLIRTYADNNGNATFQILTSGDLSSGTPGNTYGCITLDHIALRRGDFDSDGDQDSASYYLVVGPNATSTAPVDGSIAVRQLWLRWNKPTDWTGPCLQ